ncbi:hypothetical protein EG834_01220 [bacterium]|nr:hypothetical protein [bacterium]
MNKTLLGERSGGLHALPARNAEVRGWQHWAPSAAVIWSLIYAALGLYWGLSGHGFPFAAEPMVGTGGPVAGMFGPAIAWIVVIAVGIPAVVAGIAMLRGVRRFRSVLIIAGVLLAAILLLFIADLNLLVMLGYIPYIFFRLLTGADTGIYTESLIQSQWLIAHQLLCLAGGFLWLAATISYSRRSSDACLQCGRREGTEGWTSPDRAARWGRIAIYAAMVAPIFYAVTRYAWVLGIPLGMSQESLRNGQETGMWISGLFLANFGLVGALLTLGLVQRWGEVFPRWMVGLAGRRVPIGLAVIPALLAAVLLDGGGIGLWSSLGQVVPNRGSCEGKGTDVCVGVFFM